MANESKMLYVGISNDLQGRVAQHKKKLIPGFTSRYNLFMLVYWEEFSDIREAIARAKQIKGWLRSRKVALVEKRNPHWNDLARDW
ncbi:MAG TPA: GIY-YIG nuclease family protein, partial [Candidatus Acidoferrum sp.]|nr:GIY-YIG nuclease family protein [Candidatus Acidoferrum sp.]